MVNVLIQILSSACFEILCSSSGRLYCTVHAASYGMFSVRLCKQSTMLKEFLHESMANVPYGAACTLLKIDIRCSKHVEDKKI